MEVRIAAVEGLAEFPAPSHDAVIAKSTQSESPEERRRAHIARARLAETLRASGNKAAAARLLGITRRKLYSRMKSLGMDAAGG